MPSRAAMPMKNQSSGSSQEIRYLLGHRSEMYWGYANEVRFACDVPERVCRDPIRKSFLFVMGVAQA
jgi:hypothetical protein